MKKYLISVQVDFYGLRYEDCAPESSWCDG